jgi:UDP-galactopyranose mutase
MASSSTTPVVVVGGSIAGMAAAARLAKLGHPVQLFEARDRLGGSWAAYKQEGVPVDDAPSVLHFPAPWRDLFRKSGRPLEAELARTKVALTPAEPARYVFGDGSELVLPSERGDQYYALADAYGAAVASRWRDLVDDLVQVWQTLRPLGLEGELRDRGQLAPHRATLRARQSISQLADDLAEPHLAALVRSVAFRLGSHPDRTPAWCAVELAVQRTFGRWCITSAQPGQTGRSSVLVEALASRLALRKVAVQLGASVTRIDTAAPRGAVVTLADGTSVLAAAVVCTVDPWQTYTELLGPPGWRTRRTMRHWEPASAPHVAHHLVDERTATVSETVALTGDGCPTITYARPSGDLTLRSVHDYADPTPRRSAGLAWHGFNSWLDRPPVSTETPGLFLAGPFSRAGAAASAVVLSGALASYACSDHLGPPTPRAGR